MPGETQTAKEQDAIVPTVRVRLVQSLRLPPSHSVVADVTIEDGCSCTGPLLLQYDKHKEDSLGICAGDVLIQPHSGNSQLLVTNMSGFTRRLEKGEVLGRVVHADVVSPDITESSRTFAVVAETSGSTDRTRPT